MNTVEVYRAKSRLDGLFDRGKSLINDIDLQAHWARYLCVLVSGFLEISIRTLYAEYAKGSASPNVANFVEAQLADFRNPNMERILEITRSFSSQWADDLARMTQDQIKTSVDSIVAVRHAIAHGRSVGISFSIMSQYYGDAVKLVTLIEEQFQ